MSNATTGDLVLAQLATAAQAEAYFAGCFPASDAIALIIPRGVGSPLTIADASGAWRSGAAALEQLQQQLRTLSSALPADAWTGDDRQGFDREISALLAELGDSHNTAEAIGIALEVLVPVLAVWPPFCFTVGTALAAYAASFYAAAASVIGDITGVAEEIYAAGLELSEMMLTAVTCANEAIIAALIGVTAVVATAVGTDISTQQRHGNTSILGDLGQAEVDGLGQLASNALQYAGGKGLDKGVEHVGGETPAQPTHTPTAREGLDRSEGKGGRVGAHAAGSELDKGKEQGAEQGDLGTSLQDLINEGLGRRKARTTLD